MPRSDYEIVVVDNDRNGSARESCRELISFNPSVNIKYVLEPEVSNSKTANTGVRNTSGDIVAFIDDDAVADKTWLAAIQEDFLSLPVDLLTGKIILLTDERKLPEWVKGELKTALGKLDLGKVPRRLTRKELPLLGNLAFCRELFFSVGGFKESLGFQEEDYCGGEENAFAILARKKGYRLYYDPRIVVFHQVPAARLKRKYFLWRKSWEGRAAFRIDRCFKPLPVLIGIIFFRLFFYVPVLSLTMCFCLLSGLPYDVMLLARIYRNLYYGCEAFSGWQR